MLYIMYYALPCFKMYKDKGDKGLLLMLTVFNEVKRRILYGYYTLIFLLTCSDNVQCVIVSRV